jgi:hypothetical protein
LPTTFPSPGAAASPGASSPVRPRGGGKPPPKRRRVAGVGARRLGCLNPGVAMTEEERALAADPVMAGGNPASGVSISDGAESSGEEGEEEDEEEEDVAAA